MNRSVSHSSNYSASGNNEPKKLLRISSMMKGKKQEGSIRHNCKESDLKKLTEMGFTRDQAITALVQNEHNLINAINSLTR
jgi:NACalpha-BTF3-like transcription factor